MSNRAPTRNRIILRSPHGQHEEAPVKAGITNVLPGQLIMITAGTVLTAGIETRTVMPHNVAGGRCEKYFAREDSEQGKTILGGYPVLPLFSGGGSVAGYLPGDTVFGHICHPGDMVFARLQSGQVVTGGEILMSGGDGSLIVMPGSGLVFNNIAASAAVTNTTVETLFNKTYTIPKNFLQVGDRITIKGQGIATATNSTDTLTIKVYIGGLTGTAIVSSGALDVANNDIFEFEVSLVVRTIGASGTFVATGFITIGTPGTSTVKAFSLGSTAIDTTTTQVIGASATWSVANAGDSCRLDILTVDFAGRAFWPVGVAADAVDNSAGDATLNSTQTTDEFCAIRIL